MTRRMPFATGSIVGVSWKGMQRPLIFTVSSSGGVKSLLRMTLPRSANDGSVLVQRSHAPAAERQTVLDDAKPSPGQLALEPVQFSATSHTPTALRHTAELGLKTFAGQVSVVPSQFSVRSQKPAAARHGVLDDAFASAGQLGLEPSHVSTRSQTPAEPRQTAPA